MSYVNKYTHLLHLSTENLRLCNLHSALLLLKEYGVDLLLQGCDHGEELLLSGLGGGQVLKGVPPVAVVVGKTLVIAMVMVMLMFPCRRINNLLHLYL